MLSLLAEGRTVEDALDRSAVTGVREPVLPASTTFVVDGRAFTHRVEVSAWSRRTIRKERLVGPRRGPTRAPDPVLVRADTPDDEPPGWGGLAVDTHHTGPDKTRWWDARRLALHQVATGWDCTHAGEQHVRGVAASVLDVLTRIRYVGPEDVVRADALTALVQGERERKARGEVCSSLLLLDRVLDRMPASDVQRSAEALREARTVRAWVGTSSPDVARALLAPPDPAA